MEYGSMGKFSFEDLDQFLSKLKTFGLLQKKNMQESIFYNVWISILSFEHGVYLTFAYETLHCINYYASCNPKQASRD
jgi:hypothetical protein